MKPETIPIQSKTFLSTHNGYVLLILAATAFLLSFGGAVFREALQFNRTDIQNGQIWRMITAPVVHLNWHHTLLNTGTLLISWVFFGRTFNERAWIWIITGCTLGISTGLLIFNPEINWYIGLSGILYGFFSAGAVAEWRNHRWISILVFLFVIIKLTWEQILGPISLSEKLALGHVIVDTHLYGAISGILLGYYFSKKTNN
jgi:rhomboid family GlyGly-CTERM serine protease